MTFPVDFDLEDFLEGLVDLVANKRPAVCGTSSLETSLVWVATGPVVAVASRVDVADAERVCVLLGILAQLSSN